LYIVKILQSPANTSGASKAHQDGGIITSGFKNRGSYSRSFGRSKEILDEKWIKKHTVNSVLLIKIAPLKSPLSVAQVSTNSTAFLNTLMTNRRIEGLDMPILKSVDIKMPNFDEIFKKEKKEKKGVK
jgi:hypothetical protein